MILDKQEIYLNCNVDNIHREVNKCIRNIESIRQGITKDIQFAMKDEFNIDVVVIWEYE